jgi:peroxiredoxin
MPLVFALFLSISLLCVGCAPRQSSTSPEENQRILRSAIETKFVSTQGEQISLADFRGKIVLLHFLSPHCPQCAHEAPALRRLQESFQDSQFSVVGVVLQGVDPYAAQAFALQHHLQFPVLLDTEGALARVFSIEEVPSSIFLSRDGVPLLLEDPESGQITAIIPGARAWDTEKPVELIAGLVSSY